MIYDMRVYEPHAGKGAAMRDRFLQHALPAFTRCGIEVIGVFGVDGKDDLCYLTRFDDAPLRDQAWAKFKDDPAWLEAKTASERDGPLLARQTVTLLHSLLGQG